MVDGRDHLRQWRATLTANGNDGYRAVGCIAVDVEWRGARANNQMKLTSAEPSAARPRAGARTGPAVAGPSCSHLQWAAACRRSQLIWVFGNNAGLLSSQG